MCINFIDLNVSYPKNRYPIHNIDFWINGSSNYRMLSFMDAYSGYNQIKMDPIDEPNMKLIPNHGNYY